jgi:cytochrome c-type biogenesis protein CcmH
MRLKVLCTQVLALSLVTAMVTPSWAAVAQPLAEDPVVEQRLIAISEEMRCLVCQNESLAGSRADLAQDLRRELRNLIKQGKTDAEIRDFMVSRYGDFVLYRPPFKPSTYLLWLGPVTMLAIGLAMLIGFLRRRKADARAPDDDALTPEELSRSQAIIQGDRP